MTGYLVIYILNMCRRQHVVEVAVSLNYAGPALKQHTTYQVFLIMFSIVDFELSIMTAISQQVKNDLPLAIYT